MDRTRLDVRSHTSADRPLSGVHHRSSAKALPSLATPCATESMPEKTFQGLAWANATFTMEKARHFSQEKLGLLRKALNGTFFTADSQKHNEKAHTLTCKFCGQNDSQHHRFWECTHFAGCRPHPWLTSKVNEGGLPKCLTYHGWIGLPPEVHELHRLLWAQPDLTDRFEPLSFAPTDLFVDGSCANPTCPFTRIAGWGVVAAHPSDTEHWSPLAQGLVPGCCRHECAPICRSTGRPNSNLER